MDEKRRTMMDSTKASTGSSIELSVMDAMVAWYDVPKQGITIGSTVSQLTDFSRFNNHLKLYSTNKTQTSCTIKKDQIVNSMNGGGNLRMNCSDLDFGYSYSYDDLGSFSLSADTKSIDFSSTLMNVVTGWYDGGNIQFNYGYDVISLSISSSVGYYSITWPYNKIKLIVKGLSSSEMYVTIDGSSSVTKHVTKQNSDTDWEGYLDPGEVKALLGMFNGLTNFGSIGIELTLIDNVYSSAEEDRNFSIQLILEDEFPGYLVMQDCYFYNTCNNFLFNDGCVIADSILLDSTKADSNALLTCLLYLEYKYSANKTKSGILNSDSDLVTVAPVILDIFDNAGDADAFPVCSLYSSTYGVSGTMQYPANRENAYVMQNNTIRNLSDLNTNIATLSQGMCNAEMYIGAWPIEKNPMVNTNGLGINVSNATVFKRILLFNRNLTDEEIQWVKTNIMDND